MIGDVARNRVVLSVLIQVASVMLRVECSILLVRHLADAHRNGFCDLHNSTGGLVRITALTSHDEFAGGDLCKSHRHTFGQLKFHFLLRPLKFFGCSCVHRDI